MLNFGLLAPLWAALIWTIAVTSQNQCAFYCWLLFFGSKKTDIKRENKVTQNRNLSTWKWVSHCCWPQQLCRHITARAVQKNRHYCLFQSPHCTSSQERVSLTIRSPWHHRQAPSLCKPQASLSITVNTQLLNVNLYLIAIVCVCVYVCVCVCVCVCDEALMWEWGGGGRKKTSLCGQTGSTEPFQKFR